MYAKGNVLKILSLLSLFVLFASCAGLQKSPAPGEVVPAPEEVPLSGQEPPAGEGSFWDTRPRDGKLVLIGGAGTRSNRDEAIRFALLDAARKIAIHQSVRGLSVSAISIGDGAYDFYADAAVDLAFDPEYEKYVEELEFDPETDVLEVGNSVFVRTRWTPPVPLNVGFFSRGQDRPDWVLNPPETIDGFLVGVGRSNSHSRRYSAMITSYENAIGSILNSLDSSVRSGLGSIENTSGYVATSSSAIQKAEGILSQFYILEVWTDPKDNSVWTLAIARSLSDLAENSPER